MSDVGKEARELQASCEQFLKSPASLVLPASLRAMLRQLATILVKLAEREN